MAVCKPMCVSVRVYVSVRVCVFSTAEDDVITVIWQ